MHILFICSGNICRSPFAEYYTRAWFAAQGKAVTTSSRGTVDAPNVAVPADGLTAAEPFSLDLTPHPSKTVDRESLQQAEYVFVMETEHLNFLKAYFPMEGAKAVQLLHYPKKKFLSSGTVPDPYREGLRSFKKSYSIIANHLDKVLPLL